jgi:hypothetical protein
MAMKGMWKNFTIDAEDFTGEEDSFELDELLHPAQAYAHPSEVVNDPNLTLNEKRAILASWATDACGVERVPALLKAPKLGLAVTFDEIMDALRALDAEAAKGQRATRPRKQRWSSPRGGGQSIAMH